MPKYDLRCTGCDSEFNIRATMSEKSEKRIICPNCGSNELATVFKTAPAYVRAQAKCPNSGGCGSSGCRFAG